VQFEATMPTVLDRFIQQAVMQVLQAMEPDVLPIQLWVPSAAPLLLGASIATDSIRKTKFFRKQSEKVWSVCPIS
jgi:hypothetical protein